MTRSDAAIHTRHKHLHLCNQNRPVELREQFNRLTEQMCVSTITLAELCYGVEKSSRRAQNLRVVEEFVARLEALPFSIEAAAHYGQVRAEWNERVGLPAPTTC